MQLKPIVLRLKFKNMLFFVTVRTKLIDEIINRSYFKELCISK